MLTRWEEFVNKTRDDHNRFLAEASLAYQHNFLMRPVVNEYVEMLWSMLGYLGYKGERKQRQFGIKVSHDVDVPFQYHFASIMSLIKGTARSMLKERKLLRTCYAPLQYSASKIKPEKYDPYYTFDQIMDVSDRHGLKSAFYFIADHSAGPIDGDYDIFHPRIKKLLKHIDDRGHEIGLHGSYNSYNDPVQYQREWDRLNQSCQAAQVKQLPIGSRQHFLRWSTPESFSVINRAGLQYDTTLTYADHVGFRCGVCYEYPVFDILNRQQLNLIQRPLILMECSLLNACYMGLSVDAGQEIGLMLRLKVKQYNGIFSVLWHNTRFLEIDEVRLYKSLIA